MVSTGPPFLFFFSRPTSVEPLFLNPVSLSSSRYIATFNFVLSVHSYRGRRVISPPGKIGPDQSINSFPLPQSFLPFVTYVLTSLFVIGHTQGFTYAEAETDNATIVIAGIGSPQSSSTIRRGSTSRPLRSGYLSWIELKSSSSSLSILRTKRFDALSPLWTIRLLLSHPFLISIETIPSPFLR